jgi:BT1 family
VLFGSWAYNHYFKKSQFRLVTMVACFVNFIGAVLTMLFCLKITFGLSNMLFVIFTSTVTDTLHQCFVTLPLLVLFAKLIPDKIEASMFSFLMGILNLNKQFVSTNLGNLINIWVGVDLETLEESTWKLYAIQSFCALIPLIFIRLIPTRTMIRNVQKCYQYIDLYDGKPTTPEAFADFDRLDADTAARLGIRRPNRESIYKPSGRPISTVWTDR